LCETERFTASSSLQGLTQCTETKTEVFSENRLVLDVGKMYWGKAGLWEGFVGYRTGTTSSGPIITPVCSPYWHRTPRSKAPPLSAQPITSQTDPPAGRQYTKCPAKSWALRTRNPPRPPVPSQQWRWHNDILTAPNSRAFQDAWQAESSPASLPPA
jgi:hypothetical protein